MYTYVCVVHGCVHIYGELMFLVCECALCTSVYVYKYVCVHACACLYVCVCMSMCVWKVHVPSMCMYVQVCTYVCVYVQAHRHVERPLSFL